MTERSDPIAVAQRVLDIEADALRQLRGALPEDFGAVVDLILAAKGRVIVSGIGKSGHIGRKISATLASTGTPSLFVHASEASHGDMGMIGADDVVLVISMSGETPELRDVVAHTRRFGIPLVAMSRKADSTIMAAADHKLLLPDAPEACAIGMAPTTSSTLTLALGDALAVALMEERGFEPENFRVFHPGGKLGAQLATVGQLMQTDLPIVTPETSMMDTLFTMTAKGFGIALVVERGVLTGVLSDGDLRRNMDGLMERSAGEIATRTPVTISSETLALTALHAMQTRKIASIVVTEHARPVGLLRILDCLNAGIV
ncbi:KpsF/GutQ family sugar-phosphate isomerase [Pseudaestuariivita atlantica]|uniref:D-arabinose 5-phosphate n=1 Tax=Pseudaestuariivita atlantica TaxID=1317121 RepID=A0A0L1JNY7_9RHOB|nr:KpsF/GutQ family sugar-phosphate isomerase [Pseudaestuariivita atlantica]KNG93475.1 D-arabinose 5-phosphate [Pseudaestuariivita atlantica]